MANLYVSKDGNDSNNGSSWALAKLTIAAAVSAAASGDTINVASGVYSESVTMAKSLTIRGVGRAVLTNPVGTVLTCNINGGTFRFFDLCVRDATTLIQVNGSTPAVQIARCELRGGTTGLHGTSGGTTNIALSVVGTLFEGCTTAVWANAKDGDITNCTFVECATGIANAGTYGRVLSSLFWTGSVSGRKHLSLTPARSDYNVFSAVDSDRQIVSSTSLAAWQSASGQDSHSQVVAEPFADRANGVYHLPLSSTLGSAGFGGVYVGAYPPALVLSPAVNAATFNAPADSTNLSQDGSGYWGLASAGSGTYRTPVMDLGGSRTIRRLIAVASETAPGSVLDYATGDSAPRQWTMRYRGSNTSFLDADVSPPWTEANRLTDVLTAYRYLQVEYTLRTDGV